MQNKHFQPEILGFLFLAQIFTSQGSQTLISKIAIKFVYRRTIAFVWVLYSILGHFRLTEMFPSISIQYLANYSTKCKLGTIAFPRILRFRLLFQINKMNPPNRRRDLD